ncbi:excisionase family DNA-binding protein [Variovorax sp. LjRoot290]|uniref:excisionase family DNA-binding protein n=1 Tax=unclassified Variovorax TaxID=663243 RepID=UPI003ECC6932
MSTKQSPARSRRTSTARGAAKAGSAPQKAKASPRSSRVEPVFRLSFAVEPFIDIVGRHVKINDKARQAIEIDLTEALGHGGVVLTASSVTPAEQAAAEAAVADPVLTTEQAAQLAGVSRPFMVKLIDSGAVELHQRVGNQRRLLRSAVLRWRADERSRQLKALKRVSEDFDGEIFSS